MPALPRLVHQFGFILLIRVDYGLTTLFALVHPEASMTAGQCHLIGVAADAAGGVHAIARCSGIASAKLARTRMPFAHHQAEAPGPGYERDHEAGWP